MSFNTLRVPELREVAEFYGVDLTGIKGKDHIIHALQQDGVEYDDWAATQALIATDEDEVPVEAKAPAKPAPKLDAGNSVLVKMTRRNPRYDVGEYTFTQDHPYVLMSADAAQEIFDTEEGFVPANPREAQEYYS